MHELRVVVPFIFKQLNFHTEKALGAYNPEYVDLTSDPVYGYGRLLQRLWKKGQSFCIVEQDIEVGPSTIYDFRACNHRYCAAPYPWLTDVGVAMGCTRFRDSFIAEFPTAVEDALANGVTARQLDVVFMRRILWGKYRQQPHVHSEVIHHNAALALLPDASPVPLGYVPDMFGNAP
jgi:hypothetical protein